MIMKKQQLLAVFFVLFSYLALANDPSKPEATTNTAEENLSNNISMKQDDLVVEKLENGAEMVDLKGRFQMTSSVHIKDGKEYYHCSNLDDKHHHSTEEVVKDEK
jgi:hypothetical protein